MDVRQLALATMLMLADIGLFTSFLFLHVFVSPTVPTLVSSTSFHIFEESQLAVDANRLPVVFLTQQQWHMKPGLEKGLEPARAFLV